MEELRVKTVDRSVHNYFPVDILVELKIVDPRRLFTVELTELLIDLGTKVVLHTRFIILWLEGNPYQPVNLLGTDWDKAVIEPVKRFEMMGIGNMAQRPITIISPPVVIACEHTLLAARFGFHGATTMTADI